MPRGARTIDDVKRSPKKDVHNLFIEKVVLLYITQDRTVMSVRNIENRLDS